MISGKKLLFWDDDDGGILRPLLALLHVRLQDHRYGQPRDHVHHDVPRSDREELAHTLQNGFRGESYMGYVTCRICDEELGSADMYDHGFVWPEKAEHYILEHDVWTIECSELLGVVRRSKHQGAPV